MLMAKKNSSPKRTVPENRKPTRPIRIREPLVDQLDILGERNATSATAEANRAVREYLERNGLWPPPKEAG